MDISFVQMVAARTNSNTQQDGVQGRKTHRSLTRYVISVTKIYYTYYWKYILSFKYLERNSADLVGSRNVLTIKLELFHCTKLYYTTFDTIRATVDRLTASGTMWR